MEQGKQTKKHNNFMSRNVTQFRHLIKKHYIRQNDLTWVINLRDNTPCKNIDSKGSSPPEVFFKSTKSAEFKVRKEKLTGKIKPSDYDHVFLKSKDHVHHTESQLDFYGSLRKQKWTAEPGSHSQSQKQFSCIPFKERRTSVKFIKKDAMKKLKNITEDDFQPGLDGAHKQEHYSQKILKTKNYAILSTFMNARGRKQVGLPSLAWEVGLRNYR